MNSAFLCDGYKLSHPPQYPDNTTLVFDNFTPRSNTYAFEQAKDGVVVFGTQMSMQELHEHFSVNFFREEERLLYPERIPLLKKQVIGEIKREFSLYLGTDYDTTHFENLWDLGYLPIEVRALPEGTICPIRVPMTTIHNTLPEFFWLPNFLETILSNLLWKPMTSATISRAYKKLLDKWALKTTGSTEGTEWQGHDFSMRGLDSVYAAMSSGAGHLTSFSGTDSLPAVYATRKYYDAEGFIAGSVPATEHSVMCAGLKESELETFRRLLKIYPTGILSVVSDTWDLWKVLTEILPTLKEEILARDGKLVIRPDSGDPVEIICGQNIKTIVAENYKEFLEQVEEILHEELTDQTPHGEYGGDITDKFYFDGKLYKVTYSPDWNRHDKQYYFIDNWGGDKTKAVEIESKPSDKGVIELLWDIFGGTINEQGYKVLDPHIGAIYGDSITLDRTEQICARLEAKGFASTNVVLGIGSYTYQYNTRDTYGFAMKATYIEKIDWDKTELVAHGPGVSEWDMVYKGYEIFKDPITDSGMKKSAKGLLKVIDIDGVLTLKDQITWEELKQEDNLLKIIYKDGQYDNIVTFEEIRAKLKWQN